MQVQNLTMRAKGKILLENTLLAITGGRRYGLIGPNGMGKSTLLRMLARRQIPVPENLDVLLVEQVKLPGRCSTHVILCLRPSVLRSVCASGVCVFVSCSLTASSYSLPPSL